MKQYNFKSFAFFLDTKGSMVIVIFGILNILLTIAIGGYFVYNLQKEKKDRELTRLTLKALSGEEDMPSGETEKGAAAEGKEHDKGTAHEQKTKAEYGKILDLDPFTVNLSPVASSQLKFARVSISLETPTDDVTEEINGKMPQVRNIIIDIFNSKRAMDINTSEGRESIKEEIKNALNPILSTGKILAIYFTNFSVTG